MRRRRVPVFTACFFILFSAQYLNGQTAYIPPDKPRLIVTIIVEQLRYDQVEKLKNRFSDNGLRRMMNEGTTFKNARYGYVNTQSGPGHATISTGTTPSVHGITSDYWHVPLRNEIIYCTSDKNVSAVGGSFESGQHSPSQLMASTIADELFLAANGAAKVFSVGMKESSAILSAGHVRGGVFWFDYVSGSWMSSTYYMNELPAWVNDFNALRLSDSYMGKIWTPLKDAESYRDCLPDSNRFEMGFNKINRFPYDLKKLQPKGAGSVKDYSLLAETPFGNSLTKDFAMRLISEESLGKDDITDYLSVCFTANDRIGHRFGPSSVEVADALLRLDADISELIGMLNDSIGKKNILILFTSAHGVAEVPSLLEAGRIPSGYFRHTQALQLLRIYLNAIYGQGEWVKGYFDNQIYLNRTLIEDARLQLEEMQKRVARFMVQNTGVASAYPMYMFETSDFSNGFLKMASSNFMPQRSGDVLIILSPGWVETADNTVTGHNSPYDYDVHVPLIWYGWIINRATVNRKVDMADIAPTLSALCGIPLPNAVRGEPIVELLR